MLENILNFDYLMNTLTDSIKTFDYYVDWGKINLNLKKVERMLNLMKSLIGKENFEEKFKDLLNDYPEIVTVFPILLAVREKEQTIINKENLSNLEYSFKKPPFIINKEIQQKYYLFFKETGLEELLKNRKIENLVDYVFGIEVGMDTNARKNRTGTMMESIVKKNLLEICKQDYSFISQATKDKIHETWNYKIEIDKASRIFDFAIYNEAKQKLFLIEVNFYNGGGSKLKATAGEYSYLYDFLKKQNTELIWITDGMGWKTARKPLEETFIHNNKQIINLKMLFDGVLSKMIK